MESHELLGLKNVVGYGAGIKHVHGASQGRDCLLVLVEKKMDKKDLEAGDIIPSSVGSQETDVLEVGKLTTIDVVTQSTERSRPAKGGNSIGHKDITAGTFGLLVKDNKSGNPVILSNNHVLAKSNAAGMGDAIYQPGPADGGSSVDTIANLLRFVWITFDGTTNPNPPPSPPKDDSSCKIAAAVVKVLNFAARAVGSKTLIQAKTLRVAPLKVQASDNTVDAAIAAPVNAEFVTTGTKDINAVVSTAVAQMGETVFKNGRTTDSTSGDVITLNATVKVTYGANQVGTFTNQVITRPMSKGGDSGSTMYNSKNELVGLLFAGSEQVTIFNNISDVFKQLDISIL